jgi:hypothetical protein
MVSESKKKLGNLKRNLVESRIRTEAMNEKLDAKLAEVDKADFELNSVMERLHE